MAQPGTWRFSNTKTGHIVFQNPLRRREPEAIPAGRSAAGRPKSDQSRIESDVSIAFRAMAAAGMKREEQQCARHKDRERDLFHAEDADLAFAMNFQRSERPSDGDGHLRQPIVTEFLALGVPHQRDERGLELEFVEALGELVARLDGEPADRIVEDEHRSELTMEPRRSGLLRDCLHVALFRGHLRQHENMDSEIATLLRERVVELHEHLRRKNPRRVEHRIERARWQRARDGGAGHADEQRADDGDDSF